MGVDIEMIAKVPRKLTEEEVKRVAVRMQIAFGPSDSILWVDRGRHHSLSLLEPTNYKVTDSKLPDDGSSYVGLNSLGRYYGPGYTRGNLVGILAVARYLRTAFDGAEIYYGGDTGGGLQLLDDKHEAELWSLFASDKSRDYYDHSRGDETTRVCDFCEVRTNTYSWSSTECVTGCPSCGAKWKYIKTSRTHVPHLEEKQRGRS